MADLDILTEYSICDACHVLSEWEVFNKKKGENLIILHLNIRTIKKYFYHLMANIHDVVDRIDIIILSEINLTNDYYKTYEHNINIEGFGKLESVVISEGEEE